MNLEDCERRWGVLEPWIPTDAVCAEIGVFKGQFSRYLLRKSPKRLYLVDPWYRAAPRWPWVPPGENSAVDAIRQILHNFDKEIHDGQVVPIVDFSVPYLKSLPAATFDYCYVDSSHSYEGTKSELIELSRVMKPGGLVLGDDWREEKDHRHHGVCKAVTEWLEDGRGVRVFEPVARQWGVRFVT